MTRIPRNQPGDVKINYKHTHLGTWVHGQRQKYKLKTLPKRQYKKLAKLDFMFEPVHEHRWKLAFDELVEYKSKHGDCNVPFQCKQNTSLSYWVHTQRAKYSNGRLRSDRVKRLEKIGFIFGFGDSFSEPSSPKTRTRK